MPETPALAPQGAIVGTRERISPENSANNKRSLPDTHNQRRIPGVVEGEVGSEILAAMECLLSAVVAQNDSKERPEDDSTQKANRTRATVQLAHLFDFYHRLGPTRCSRRVRFPWVVDCHASTGAAGCNSGYRRVNFARK